MGRAGLLIRLRPILEGAVVVVFALLIWNNFALRRQQAIMARAAVQSRGFVPKDEIGDVSMVDLSGVPGGCASARGDRHDPSPDLIHKVWSAFSLETRDLQPVTPEVAGSRPVITA